MQIELVSDYYIGIIVIGPNDLVPVGYTADLLPLDVDTSDLSSDCAVYWKRLTYPDVATEVYEDLEKLIWTMCHDVKNPNIWQLDVQELFGELSMTLAEVVETYYGEKAYIELKSLCVRSMRNRLYDIIRKYYKTHRNVEGNMAALTPDGAALDIGDDRELSIPEMGTSVSTFDLAAFVSNLSDDAKEVVKELITPSKRGRTIAKLVDCRKEVVSTKGLHKFGISRAMLRRCLGWSSFRYEVVCVEISSKLAKL